MLNVDPESVLTLLSVLFRGPPRSAVPSGVLAPIIITTATSRQVIRATPVPSAQLGASDPSDISFHDVRRSCATLLVSRGHHPKLVQELLGHASVTMTLQRYSHVLPGMREQTAAAMQAALLLERPLRRALVYKGPGEYWPFRCRSVYPANGQPLKRRRDSNPRYPVEVLRATR